MTFRFILTIYNLEIGAIMLLQKIFCIAKLSVELLEDNFCDTEIGTYDQQWIAAYKHSKQENNQAQ